MSWLDMLGGSAGIGTIGSLIGTGASIYSGYQAGKQADKLADSATASAALQKEIAEYQRELGEQGGDDLEKVLTAFLGNAGDVGFFSPDRISGMSSDFYNDILTDRDEISRNQTNLINNAGADANNLAAQILGISDGLSPEGSAMSTIKAGTELPWGPEVTAMMKEQGIDPYEAAAAITGDPQFDLNANPEDFYGKFNDVAGQIYESLGHNTDKAIDIAMGNRQASVADRGMEGGTFDLLSRKMAAEFAADRMADDQQLAVDRAFQMLGGYDNLAGSKQQLELAELGGVLSQDRIGLDARAQELAETMQSISGATDLIGDTKGLTWGDRSSSLQEIGGIRGMAGSDTFDANNMALALEGGLQGIRQGTLNEINSTVTAPYSYKANGAAAAAQPLYASGQTFTDLAKTYSGAAGSAGKSAATWFDQANKWWNS